MCSKRRHVRLLCLLGTSCEVPPSAATGGTSECMGAFWGRKTLELAWPHTAHRRGQISAESTSEPRQALEGIIIG